MQKTLEQALPEILSKALERDFRITVKSTDKEHLEEIDKFLWTYNPESFLPHGYLKNGHESEQPIWLTTKDDNPNDSKLLILVNGAASDKIDDMDLCCEIFDGNNDEAVKQARTSWKEYTEKGYELAYFQQDDNGKWQKK